MIKKYLALIVFFAIASTNTNAQHRLTGQQVWNFASLTAKEQKQFSPRSLNGPYNCMPVRLSEAFIKADLQLNRNYVSDPAFAMTVSLEITAMRNGLPDVKVITFSPVTLQLTAQKPSATFASPITSQYDDVDYVMVKVTSVTSGFADIANQVQLKVYTSEDLGFDVRENSLTLQQPQENNGKVTFTWDPSCDNSPYYEVQTLRLFNNNPDYTTNNEHIRATVDWSRALSTYTKDSSPSLSLTVAEGTGFYIWRVRPVGNYFEGGSNNPLNLGVFAGSENFPSGTTVEHGDLAGNDAFYFTPPDADKNKMFTRVYSDQGKSGESMVFADGFLNTHQVQAYDPDHEKVITAQTVHDNYGRKAVVTMSVPVDQQHLKYVSGVLSDNSAPYSAKNFANKPTPDAASGLVSDFYSDGNPDATIPSAGGYPFSQTRYDNQGRVAEISSPGEFFKIGTSRTVKTFYEAAKQFELDNLFGREAPNASRVTKVITFDANRRASVSYYQGEQILATSLGVTGSDGPMEDLPSKADATSTRTENMIGETVSSSNDEIVSVTDQFFLSPQTVEFHYTLSSEAFQVLCAPALDLNKTLDYSGRIEVINKQTGEIVSSPFSVDTNFPNALAVDMTFNVQVEEGGYQIRRILRTNNVAANGKSSIENYIAEARAELEQSLQAEPTLTEIFAYLDDNDPAGLFNFLQVVKDESGYWPADVTIALQSCCSITIPVQLCPDPCASADLDFEAYLLAKYPALGENINDFFYRRGAPLISDVWGTEDWFNRLIENMTDDGYTCKELFGCWQKVVDQYGDVGTYIPGGGLDFQRQPDPAYDLLQAFLDCTGTMYQGYSIQPESWLENAHKYFRYTSGNEKDCEQAFGFDSAAPWPPDVRSDLKENQQWAVFYNCVIAGGLGGESAASEYGGAIGGACLSLENETEILACLEQSRNKAQSECAGLCESRYTSIIMQLIQAYLAGGYTVQLEPGAEGSYDVLYSDLNCKAEAAIKTCQQMCSLSYVTDGQGHTVGLGTEAEQENMRRAMTEQMEVSIDACPLGESTNDSQTDELPKFALEFSLEAFLNNVGPEGGCWNYAAVIEGAELSTVVDGLESCGTGRVFVKPGIPYSLTVDGCKLTFIQEITPEAACFDARHLFVQLLNHTFGILDSGNGTVLETSDFPEGISFKTEGGGNACLNLSSLGITKKDGAESCGIIEVVGGLGSPNDLDLSYHPGTYFVLAENGVNIYAKREGQIIDVLCLSLCCDEGDIENGTLIGSVEATFDCRPTICSPVCISWHPLQLPPTVFDPPTCETETAHHVREVINAQLEKFIDNQLKKIEKSYIEAFHKTKDNLMVTYSNGQHHFTLYYYDRAGNRIRTVSPKGVDFVDSRNVLPQHTYETTYAYNSLGQLIHSNSPDGGDTYIINDKLGRVRFTVGANQLAAHNRFSYVLYDELGRPRESGEAITNVEVSIDELKAKALNDENYPDLSDPDIASFKNVSQTHFNEPYPDFVYANYEQQNLVGNVSYRITDGDGNKGTTDDQVIDLSSYDVHNNATWTAQIIPGLGINVTEYYYNVLSGLVTEIKYNPGRPDQFFKRFLYNSNNSMVAVETSTDYVVWTTDAAYQYHAHGPLKRAMIGEDNVQGIDHTYTLDGSLKALNHPSLLSMKDPGNDGANSFAKDAFGMVLEYNADDFIRTGSVFNESGARIGAAINNAGTVRNQFDGNIAAMITNTQVVDGLQNGYQASQFVYDELRRLVQSTVSKRENNSWINDGGYATAYTYDPNGNIGSLHRTGDALQGIPMDDLEYIYEPGTNKLKQVTDAVHEDVYTTDLSTQAVNNYQYDEAGQLVADVAEGLEIEWTWFSKPATVTKTNGTIIRFIYGNDHQRIAKKVFTPDGKLKTTFYVNDGSGKPISIYERFDEPAPAGQVKTIIVWRESPIMGLGRVGSVRHDLTLKETIHNANAVVTLDLKPFNNFAAPEDLQFSYKLTALTSGTYSFNSFTEDQISKDEATAGSMKVDDLWLNASNTLSMSQSVATAPSSENTKQMSTALDGAGQRIFTAYSTRLNAANSVVVRDRTGGIVPMAVNIASSDLNHHFDRPIIFIKKPGSENQYYLITQLSNGASDFIYRHTLDASLPGNGDLEEPMGEFIETNYLLLTNNNALRYGASAQAIQNAGSSNSTSMYFLRSSATQVQLTARALNLNGTLGSSLNVAAVNGKPLSRIKFSPDGKQLLFAYLQPFVLGQVQSAILRRYGIGPNGELALIESKTLSKNLLDFEFSPDGKFIYYALTISETPQIAVKGFTIMLAGNKFQLRRLNVSTQADEMIGNSFDDEIFNGKHLSLQRSANGRMYISAAGHRRMMVVNDPDAMKVPAMFGEEVVDNDPLKTPYLSGAFTTTAFDHHFHTIPNNGTFYATRNKREYELKDHLGNVNVVFSDMRAADGSATVVSANNYYPYGMIMPGRNYNSSNYRYGFNGMEKDDEIKGSGNSYDFGARLYDSRIGRWLTRDPLAHEFPDLSPYNAFGANPIYYVDPDGRKIVVHQAVLKYGPDGGSPIGFKKPIVHEYKIGKVFCSTPRDDDDFVTTVFETLNFAAETDPQLRELIKQWEESDEIITISDAAEMNFMIYNAMNERDDHPVYYDNFVRSFYNGGENIWWHEDLGFAAPTKNHQTGKDDWNIMSPSAVLMQKLGEAAFKRLYPRGSRKKEIPHALELSTQSNIVTDVVVGSMPLLAKISGFFPIKKRSGDWFYASHPLSVKLQGGFTSPHGSDLTKEDYKKMAEQAREYDKFLSEMYELVRGVKRPEKD
jgi:RHS repeat-associated protein